jgi:hypothetical protein
MCHTCVHPYILQVSKQKKSRIKDQIENLRPKKISRKLGLGKGFAPVHQTLGDKLL